MRVRHGVGRLVALTAVLSMTVFASFGVAQAKPHHPKNMIVTTSPSTVVETGQSEVHAVIQVEALSALAGQSVAITSPELEQSCAGEIVFQYLPSSTNAVPLTQPNGIVAILDNDGNATVVVDGADCTPGRSMVDADLQGALGFTASASLTVTSPVVTHSGVTGFPKSEVESGEYSDTYAVFAVEAKVAYAGQPVELDSAQLESRCSGGWLWEPGNGGTPDDGTGLGGEIPETTLDSFGNAVFVFEGVSCESGVSTVVAEVKAGTYPTYRTTFKILAPKPTI
jgi:hypothetical protein